MKETIQKAVAEAAGSAASELGLETAPDLAKFVVERPANPEFGHFSTNAAMVYAKLFAPKMEFKGSPALALASVLKSKLEGSDLFESVEIKGPGFINFRVGAKEWTRALARILSEGDGYGRGVPTGRRVLVEFVSSNPTGPLHVGHGRGAAWGDAAARILSFLGDEVSREYYVNDAGNQIRNLGKSVLFRLERPDGEAPDGLYKGAYVLDIASELKARHPAAWFARPEAELLPELSREAAELMLSGMKADLDRFGVRFDAWFSERSLFSSGAVERTVAALTAAGWTYESDGALFFRSTEFGDDKDRVLVKSGGDLTYFASDAAYHADKFARGFDLAVDVLGADHGGYLARMSAVVQAMGFDKSRLKIVLYQLVRLTRAGEAYRMSTRAGEFVPLKAVLDEVSPDAARFMYLTQSHDSALEFDVDLAKARTSDNPVFYVQYLCARICQVLKKAAPLLEAAGPPDLGLLKEPRERELAIQLAGFPDAVRSAARNLAPHLMASWLTETAGLFHQYYGATRMVTEDDPALTAARCALASACRLVVASGLGLLGVSAPERMDLNPAPQPPRGTPGDEGE
ncbi:MAG: arginine--tRNA ligase [Deltaproteobacteria bacterium]|nr:arginine--tRNA ligase [Deltaproteobacteria bacterium]